MVHFLPEPRLDYKATSKVLFRKGSLMEELRDIRRHHASSINQFIHMVTTVLFFAFLSTTVVLFFRLLTFSDAILIFLIIIFFPVPYLGFYWYLDPLIAIFWTPFFMIAVFGSIFMADELSHLMPVYAALPLSFAFTFLALLPQLIGHLLLEEANVPAFHLFELVVMTPFFLGYCCCGWMCCWKLRRDTTDQIWREEEEEKPAPTSTKDKADLKDLER